MYLCECRLGVIRLPDTVGAFKQKKGGWITFSVRLGCNSTSEGVVCHVSLSRHTCVFVFLFIVHCVQCGVVSWVSTPRRFHNTPAAVSQLKVFKTVKQTNTQLMLRPISYTAAYSLRYVYVLFHLKCRLKNLLHWLFIQPDIVFMLANFSNYKRLFYLFYYIQLVVSDILILPTSFSVDAEAVEVFARSSSTDKTLYSCVIFIFLSLI